jgi:hypothetical protein
MQDGLGWHVLRGRKLEQEVEGVGWLGGGGVSKGKGVLVKDNVARSDDPT